MPNPLTEFQRLSDHKELMLLNLVGVVQHAISNLNLNDPPAALRTLMLGYEKYVRADEAVSEFHSSEKSKSTQSQTRTNAAQEAA